jgi:hypothetical protein
MREFFFSWVFGSGVFFLTQSKFCRKLRLRLKLSSTDPFAGGNVSPSLAKRVESEVSDGLGGVKVLWGPSGAGKTATVRAVLQQMQHNGRISGSAVITPPPPELGIRPAAWFSGGLGGVLLPCEKLSDLLPQHLPPFVIVIDQMEACPPSESLRVMVKTLAEDSSLTLKYVVIIVTSDSAAALTMWEWNGRQKITLMFDPAEAECHSSFAPLLSNS